MLSAILASAFLLTWLAVRPEDSSVAPARLATARAAVVVGAYAVTPIEFLSDVAALPLQALLLIAGTLAALRPDRTDSRRRWLAVVLVVASLGYAIAFKWQPWGNRLVLFAVLPRRPAHRDLAGPGFRYPTTLTERAGGCRVGARHTGRSRVRGVRLPETPGRKAVGIGVRRLARPIHRTPVVGQRLRRRRGEDPCLRRAPHRTGPGHRQLEVPWWIAFRGRQIYALQSFDPQRLPPARLDDVEAVVCTSELAECRSYLPAGWTVAPSRDG